MIALTTAQIADVVDGVVVGDATAVVDAPAVIDSRQIEAGGLFVALAGENADGHDFVDAAAAGGAAAALVARRLDPAPLPLIVVDDVTAALGLLARHVHDTLSAAGLRTLALTGSAGKTSTKDLLTHLLEQSGPTVAPTGSFNNEWGVPLTVLRADHDTQFLVVEMGARGIGHIADLCAITPPDVAAVLNVGSAHVGEFGGLDHTARAKGEIVEALTPAGTAVLNLDDERVRAMAERTVAPVVTFGTDPAAVVQLAALELDAAGFPVVTLMYGGASVTAAVPQVGVHHGANAAAAVAMAVAAGLDFTTAAERLATAAARSPHRMARHELADGVVVVDDAYNANPESMRAAVEWLGTAAGERGIAVLGAMLELGPESAALHRDVGAFAARSGLREVIAIGEEAAPIAEGAGPIGTVVADITSAVDLVRARLRAGDVVLVKASRGCRLERVVDALRAATGHTAEG